MATSSPVASAPYMCFDPNISNAPPPPTSYMFYSDQEFCFEDPELHLFSLKPSFEIEGKPVVFTINKRPAIYYENEFFYNIIGFLKRVNEQNINKDKFEEISHFLEG